MAKRQAVLFGRSDCGGVQGLRHVAAMKTENNLGSSPNMPWRTVKLDRRQVLNGDLAIITGRRRAHMDSD